MLRAVDVSLQSEVRPCVCVVVHAAINDGVQEELLARMRELDRDGDGKLKFDEIKHMMVRFPLSQAPTLLHDGADAGARDLQEHAEGSLLRRAVA